MVIIEDAPVRIEADELAVLLQGGVGDDLVPDLGVGRPQAHVPADLGRSCCWTSCSRVCCGMPSCWMSCALISPPNCLLIDSSLDRRAWKKASEEIFVPPTLARVPDRLVSPRRPAPPQMAKIATMNVATMSQRTGLSDLTFFLMVFSMGSPRRAGVRLRAAPVPPAASPLMIEQGTQLLIGRVQVLDEDLVSPTRGMKLESPVQRGTTWRW